MLKKIMSPVLIATALVTFAYPNVAHALDLSLPSDFSSDSSSMGTPLVWTAINLGGRSMSSNYDVKKFLEVAHLTDSNLVTMFKQADGDYTKYEALKEEWLQSHFKEGLKQMAYIQMVQKYATRSYDKKKWKAFKTTEREYYDAIESMEEKALKKLLDEGKGIVYARKKFGEELIKVGYPHKADQDGEKVYWTWYELQKSRIKENFRIKELKKYEYLHALGYSQEFYVRPTEIFDFAKEVTAKIDSKIQNKRISQAQAGKLVTQDPSLQVILKGVTFYGPETTKLDVLRDKAPAVYSDFLKNIDTNVISFINGEFSAKMQRYEAIAAKMADKYETAEKLATLSEDMKKEFVTSNDYSRLMMSKIYDLASAGIKDGTYAQKSSERQAGNSIMSNYLSALSKHAADFLTNEKAMLDAQSQGVRLEDNFSGMINDDFHANKIAGFDTKQIKEASYLDEVRKLAHWVLKFQVKKASLNTIPLASATLYDVKTFEGQDRIEKFLKNKQFKDKVESFKKNDLRSYFNGILTINPTGHDYYTDIKAVNFVLGIKDQNTNSSFDLFGQH